METIFWISVTVVLYTFLGYGILITLLNWIAPKRAKLNPLSEQELPEVTLLIAAYNEAEIIVQKVLNSTRLDYPKHLLKIAFVTDGSTDGSVKLLGGYPDIQVFHSLARKGKIAAVNRVMPQIKTPITVFSDANVMLNPEAIKELVKHFQRKEVGAVSGEKKVISKEVDAASASGEGFYWKYESYLKRKDAQWNSLVGSAGELFAIRTKLYQAPEPDTLIEDFVMTMRLASQGHVVAYEPAAVATETASANVEEEHKRKVRISAGGIQAVGRLGEVWRFWNHPGLTFQYLSHRVLRWTLLPLAMLAAFISNVILLESGLFYLMTFVIQLAFYYLAIQGYRMRNQPMKTKVYQLPFYFLFMQICVVQGWFRLAKGKQQVTWEKARRIQMEPSIS
ncbi:cellulose synthase/poly-beta-1,6-N-acetylglucosamine synthase-like glycosyltransferase [Algoriphagus boseongensis]|uniref:Cellulose synthase/poly-beta-1,6-N-acetylglucosamine synthase-like glycosyltransferase n=1 Tax=Algoriphagus boseongensis TaxID=1442587 RepID=A0A4R6T3N2_9BACT|nr:glycosyltransferase family 2 protein [Algoriphagus boseongensis]TDQ17051.1 cellulose synthase/poly-beta-1,6-N-acetylglucosamine synthase-like glycosyltransferase [Algoriphagus boseongensis]